MVDGTWSVVDVAMAAVAQSLAVDVAAATVPSCTRALLARMLLG